MGMKTKRRLFCEWSPVTYWLSVEKCRLVRHGQNLLAHAMLAHERSEMLLPQRLYVHASLIRRQLGNVDSRLQDNKAINLALATPQVSHVLIRPGEEFSFWHLVGACTARKGYREGLIISNGRAGTGIGGGLCQFTNLIHWMVLHTPLQITEHHHHDQFDLFPDNGRQIPFGTGTSIFYNYLDYRFYNPTDITFQLITYVDEPYLRGELRADRRPEVAYHIHVEGECFTREGDTVYRNGRVYRDCVDVRTGNRLSRECIKENHARVLYDVTGLEVTEVSAGSGNEKIRQERIDRKIGACYDTTITAASGE